jgi:hypothetical protein
MDVNEVLLIVGSVREQFEREKDQALLQNDWNGAKERLAGQWACERVERAISARAGLAPVVLRSARRPR